MESQVEARPECRNGINVRFLCACALFSLFVPVSAADAQEHKIVERSELAKFWLSEEFGADQLEITMGVGRDMTYGCATFGYVIDRSGIAKNTVLLRVASSKGMRYSRRDQLSRYIASLLVSTVKYSPAPENQEKTEVFTSVTLSFLGKGIKQSLSAAEQDAANKQLQDYCRIDRLRAWLGSHDVEKLPVIDVAPELQKTN